VSFDCVIFCVLAFCLGRPFFSGHGVHICWKTCMDFRTNKYSRPLYYAW